MHDRTFKEHVALTAAVNHPAGRAAMAFGLLREMTWEIAYVQPERDYLDTDDVYTFALALGCILKGGFLADLLAHPEFDKAMQLRHDIPPTVIGFLRVAARLARADDDGEAG